MTKGIQRIAAASIIGLLAFSGNALTARAAETPLAGIDMVFNVTNLDDPSTVTDIREFVASNIQTEFAGLAIAQADNYVNIRSKANESGEILGKLYNNSAATILGQKGNWYQISSGTVTGYVNADYLVTGDNVSKVAKTAGKRIATVTTTTLKVRESASLDAPVITLVPIDEKLSVLKETEGWVKIALDGNARGYVSSDYVKVSTEFSKAVSLEEEQANRQAEENSQRTGTQTASAKTTASTRTKTSISSYSMKESTESSSTIRDNIVNYAKQFIGNPYVWGGTSLTRGADCSGFTQSVFRDNGIYIPRSSREQAYGGGSSVSISNMRPGDLIFYTRGGSINHVAIYIGNGKVISASSPDTGIRITDYNYRQPYKVVDYIG